MSVDIIILAAGQGTRMMSSRPKVLHRLAGRPLLQHVLDAVGRIDDARIIVITGHGAEEVQRSVATGPDICWVEQAEQMGTAHAVLQALPELRPDAKVLVLYGDVPLIRVATLRAMLDSAQCHDLCLLTITMADPTGYGRILRDAEGRVQAIVEQKDASEEQLAIDEINTGVLVANSSDLRRWLPQIDNDNAQREYYLTDVVSMARREGMEIATRQPAEPWEVEGVNSRCQLAALERRFQRICAERLMEQGVSLADPDRFDCRGLLTAGADTSIDVNCVFEGEVVLGSAVRIGPNCLIIDCTIADGVEIKANSVLEEADIGKGCVIGPFARLRPGTQLSDNARIGNFVETKKALVGRGSKINHLSYVGDALLGEDVNVGAGTITCNYDGVNKHRTIIGDRAFIGSNTSLVAPVTIGRDATLGAGSTIVQDVPDEELAVARGKQRNIRGWQKPQKRKP